VYHPTQALNIYAVKNNGQKVLRPRSFSVSGNLTMSASALTTNPQGDAQLGVTLNAVRGQSYFIVVNDAQGVSGSVQFIDQSIPLIVDSVRVSNSYEVVLVTGNQINLDEGLTYQLQWFVKEAQGVSISYSFNGYSAFQPSGNGSVMVSPSYQDAGTKNILLSLSDGVTVTTYNYVVSVKNVNQIPKLALNYLEVTENQMVTGSIAVIDGDNEILQVVVSPNIKPFEFAFSGNQLFYQFSPDLKSAGQKFFEIKIDSTQISQDFFFYFYLFFIFTE
jgi:hypothetical protein